MIKKLHVLVWLLAAVNLISSVQSREKFQSNKSVHQGTSYRGGSFGLENYLMQSFDDENFNGDMNLDLEKETPKSSTRGQTYGLESMTRDLSGYSNSYPQEEQPDRRRQQHRHATGQPPLVRFEKEAGKSDEYRSFSSVEKEKNDYSMNNAEKKIQYGNETIRKPLERPITFRKTEISEMQERHKNRPENVTGRPRKRIAMRRRKRPLTETRDTSLNSTGFETKTENSVLEPSNRTDFVLFSSTTTKPLNEISNESRPEQPQQFQQARTRPMGFRVHARREDDEKSSGPVEEKSAANKIESGSSGEGIKNNHLEEVDPRLGDSSRPKAEEKSADETQVKSFNKLKLFLRKHQSGATGVSLSELLQTQNLSLTDILSGNKQDVVVDSDVTTESPSRRYHHHRQDVKSRQDVFPSRSPSNSIPSVASRPFTKNEKTEGYRYTKKKYRQDDRNDLDITKKDNEDDPGTVERNVEETSYDEPSPPKNRTRKFHKNSEAVDGEDKKDLSNGKKIFREKSSSINEQDKRGSSAEGNHSAKNSTENRKLSTSLFNYRRKLKIPNENYHQPPETDLEPVTKLSPSNVEQTSSTPIVQISSSSTTEASEKGYLRRNIKTPFKSSNNPELALIFPHQKRKNYLNDRITGIKFPNLNSAKKEGGSEEDEQDGQFYTTVRSRDKDLVKKNEKPAQEGKLVTSNNSSGSDDKARRAQDGGKDQNAEVESTETAEPNKDEILELLKSAATAQKLEKILASRNMTIGELLLNREKGSVQTNFSRLFLSQETSKYSDTSTIPTSTIIEVYENSKNDAKHDGRKQVAPPFSDLMETDESNPVVKRVEIYVPLDDKRETRRPADGDFRLGFQDLFTQPDDNRASDLSRLHKKFGIDTLFERGEAISDYKLLVPPLPQDGDHPISTTKPQTSGTHQVLETRFESEIAAEEAWNAKIVPENKKGYLSHEIFPASETEKHSERDKSFIPPVIKSTIIISGVVMGIALIVFIAIFAACGWRQRQLRLKADSSILNETLTWSKSSSKKKKASSRALSPIEIKRSSTYKKTLDFDDSRSVISVSSEASSYLWNTLKNTFTSRNNTLKNRLEKEACLNIRGGGTNIAKKSQASNQRVNSEINKYEERLNSLHRENREKYCPTWQKNQPSNKDLTKTTDSFKRGVLINNTCSNTGNSKNYSFDTWTHN